MAAAAGRRRPQPKRRDRAMHLFRIAGTGSYLPAQVLTNDDLAARGSTPPTSGSARAPASAQRHIADDDADVERPRARGARARALEAAGVDAERHRPDHRRDVDARHGLPVSTACILQAKLGVARLRRRSTCRRCARLRLRARHRRLASSRPACASKALVVGAEVFSRILDWNDRSTCVLFGDGAGAVVLERQRRRRASSRASCTPTAATPTSCACRATSRGGAIVGDAVPADGRPGGVQVRGAACSTRSPREALAAGRHERRRHRLADPAPGQHPHHASDGEEARACRSSKLIVTVDQHGNTRPRRFRSRSTTRCATAASSAGEHVLLRRRRRRLHLGRGCSLTTG